MLSGMMVSHKKLKSADVAKRQQKLAGWSLNAKSTTLSKAFEFNSFLDALTFTARIAVHAEILQHHPEINITYGKVRVLLTTHDVDGLTGLDFELAKRIEKLS
jgi:4a-hydroxytetrahydrobiopterin dehydratase